MTLFNNKNGSKKIGAFHPFLFSAFSVAALFANNLNETEPVSILRILVAVLAFTFLIFIVFRLFILDSLKAALSTTIIILFALS